MPVEIDSSNSHQDEKKKRMAKYPTITEGLPKEALPYRFINDVGHKGAYKEEPDIYAAS